MPFNFTPTKEYLPQYYAQCEDMIQICDALDKLYFREFYTDVCLKSQIFGLFRNDMATKDTYDTVYESALNRSLGISGVWADQNGKIGEKFPEDWPHRRICVWLLLAQMVHRPFYTSTSIKHFISELERILRFYAETDPWIKSEIDEEDNMNAVILKPRKEIPNVGGVLDVYAPVLEDVMLVLRRIVPLNITIEVIPT